jgi:hypothetical protein
MKSEMSPQSGRQRCRLLRRLNLFYRFDPGACAPGFMLSPASQVQRLLIRWFTHGIEDADFALRERATVEVDDQRVESN